MEAAMTIFLSVAVAHMLAVASPGPDFAVVVRQSLAFGRAAGLWTALGIGCGITVHVAYGLFGLGWATERWPFLLDLLGWAGAAFLIWMGQGALRAKPSAEDAASAPAEALPLGLSLGLGRGGSHVARCAGTTAPDAERPGAFSLTDLLQSLPPPLGGP